MALSTLHLTNFRSYKEREFELGPNVTLVVGPNASGKTNLLESLYVLALTKSFRARDPELIHHGGDFFRIEASGAQGELALGYSNENGVQAKRATHNTAQKPLSSHIGTLPVILFEPSDLDLVGGAPERRRRYLDAILYQTDPAYAKHHNQYRRVLKQRNSLLSAFDTGRIRDEIFIWDLKLTELAAEIVGKRRELIGFINERLPELYGQIAGSAEAIELTYLPSVNGDSYQDGFVAELARRLTTDLAAGFTTIGPHREDFKISFKNNDMSAVASRGETRTAVLGLKLAEIAYNSQYAQAKPLLLLDDVFSELDSSRRRHLTKQIAGYQTIITTTEADTVSGLRKDHTLIKTKV